MGKKPLPGMHSPCVPLTESYIHAQWEGKKGDLRGGHGRERILVQTPAEKKKKFRVLHNETMGGGELSSLILVVPVENIRIF